MSLYSRVTAFEKEVGLLKEKLVKDVLGGFSNPFNVNDENGAWFMKRFKIVFSESEPQVYQLPKTFRCQKSIVQRSNIVSKILDGTEAIAESNEDGFVVVQDVFQCSRDEVGWVLQKIKKYMDDKKSIKILYRTNSQSLVYQLAFIKNDIPYTIKEQCNLFKYKEIQCAFDAWDILTKRDSLTKYQIATKMKVLWGAIIPPSYSHYTMLQEMKSLCNDVVPEQYLPAFKKVMQSISTMNIDENKISDVFSKLAEYIESMDLYNYFGANAYENLIGASELFDECTTFDECKAIMDKIVMGYESHRTGEAVSLSTIHGSKGLESDIVFVVGVNNGLFPHKFNPDQREEKNLLYVAMTRARHGLYMSGSRLVGTKVFTGHEFLDIVKQ